MNLELNKIFLKIYQNYLKYNNFEMNLGLIILILIPLVLLKVLIHQ